MRTRLRLGIGCIFLFILISLHVSGVFKHITIENIRACGEQCVLLAEQHYAMSVVSYCITYTVVILFALPMATIMTLIGGYLFGMPIGAICAIISATVGAILSFLVVRYCLGDVVQKKYESQLKRLNEEIIQYGANYLLILRLVHVVPFFLVNILAALTVIPLSTFTIITLIGVIPSACIFGFVGKQLHTIQTITDVISLPIIGAFMVLTILAAIPLTVRYFRKRKAKT